MNLRTVVLLHLNRQKIDLLENRFHLAPFKYRGSILHNRFRIDLKLFLFLCMSDVEVLTEKSLKLIKQFNLTIFASDSRLRLDVHSKKKSYRNLIQLELETTELL